MAIRKNANLAELSKNFDLSAKCGRIECSAVAGAAEPAGGRTLPLGRTFFVSRFIRFGFSLHSFIRFAGRWDDGTLAKGAPTSSLLRAAVYLRQRRSSAGSLEFAAPLLKAAWPTISRRAFSRRGAQLRRRGVAGRSES